MMDWYKEAGKRISRTRIKRGYTRDYLAEKAFISSKFLYEIESGRKGFSAEVLYKLCTVLRIDSDYILTGEEKAEYDRKLIETLHLFNQDQIKRLSTILEQIYDMFYSFE